MEKDQVSEVQEVQGYVFVSMSMSIIGDFPLFTYSFHSEAFEEQQCNQRDVNSFVYGFTLSRRVRK